MRVFCCQTKPKGVKRKDCMAEADTTKDPAGSNPPAEGNDGDKKGGNSKTFTQEDVNNFVSKRLNEEKAKTDKAIKDAVAEAKAEWNRQAKLTEEERAKEAQEARTRELDERDREITLRERRSEALETLAEKGISTKLVDLVVDADADRTAKNIETLSKEFNKAVEEGVKAKLAGGTPKDKGAKPAGDGSKAAANNGVYRNDGVSAF